MGCDPGSPARAEGLDSWRRSSRCRSACSPRRRLGPWRRRREAAARRLRYRLIATSAASSGALGAHATTPTTRRRPCCCGWPTARARRARRHRGPPRHVLRPLLALRRGISAAGNAAGLRPLDDPPISTRGAAQPPAPAAAAGPRRRLGGGARPQRRRRRGSLAAGVERRLVALLPELDDVEDEGGRECRSTRAAASAELLPWALALLHRRAGAAYPRVRPPSPSCDASSTTRRRRVRQRRRLAVAHRLRRAPGVAPTPAPPHLSLILSR